MSTSAASGTSEKSLIKIFRDFNFLLSSEFDVFCKHSLVRLSSFKRNFRVHAKFSYHETVKHAEDVTELAIVFNPSDHIFFGLGEEFRNLRILTITQDTIECIERNDFLNMKQLKELVLSYNPINFVAKDALWDLHELERLFLEHCKIESLTKDVFKNLPRLENLFLTRNRLTHLDQRSFNNLLQLREINLSENPISFIASDTSWNLPNLEKLSISSAQIEEIPKDFFARMRKLKGIWLGINHLKRLDRDLFRNNFEMEDFGFWQNKLVWIDVDFTEFQKIKYLDLHENDCINDKYKQDLVGVVRSISRLHEVQETINRECRTEVIWRFPSF